MVKDIISKIKQAFEDHRWLKPVVIIVLIVIVLAVAGAIAFQSIFGGLKHVELDTADLGIVEEATEGVEEEKLKNITSIALFGIDTTEGAATIGDQYRSDCIIVFTIDPIENVLKMTSILRDTKVPIEGHDPQKINAAYKYGGAQLAVKTVNQNFKTNIKDYMTVDFAEMADIIDLVGGLTIEITEAEAKNMMENNIIDPVKAGVRHLDGKQSVAFARVRKVDSDYYRASRQQLVLNLVFEKIQQMPADQYPALIKSFLKCVETSLSYSDIMKFVRGMDVSNVKIIKNTIPDPKFEKNLWGGIDNTGSWVWVYDLDAAADRLREIIYGKPWTPKDKQKETTAGYNYGGNNGGKQTNPYYGGGSEQPVTKRPEETTRAPEEETTKEPSTEVPQPTTEAPQPTTEAPQPTTEAPQPTTEIPQPTTEAPQPTTEAPQPTTEAPQPSTEAPQPSTEAPQPSTEAPQPTTEAPQPSTEAPQPITDPPEDPPEGGDADADADADAVLNEISIAEKEWSVLWINILTG